MSADEVPPEMVQRIAANVFDAVKAQRAVNIAAARDTFTAEALEQADMFLWSIELKVSTE